jgi:hypothetical protein
LSIPSSEFTVSPASAPLGIVCRRLDLRANFPLILTPCRVPSLPCNSSFEKTRKKRPRSDPGPLLPWLLNPSTYRACRRLGQQAQPARLPSARPRRIPW